MGFQLNPYDLCVANKVIDESQCTICFYVDDNTISHKDPNVVQKVISDLEKRFGPLTVILDKKFDFLGMNIELTNIKAIKILMKKQIREALEWLGEDITQKSITPANKYLFNVNDESEQLSEE